MKPASHIDIARFINKHPQYTTIARELKARAMRHARSGQCEYTTKGKGYPYQFKPADLLRWAEELTAPAITVEPVHPAVIKYAYVEHNSAYYVYTINGIAMKLFAKFVYQQDAEHYCNLMNSTPTLDATH